MARVRMRWIVAAIVLFVALVAIVLGGFLWPRPQWRKGPWNRPAPAESLPAPAPPAG